MYNIQNYHVKCFSINTYYNITRFIFRKPSMTYKNPYLNSEKSNSQRILQKPNRSKIKEYLESPIVKKIYDICDSDTNSDTSPFVLKKTKGKIIFDESFDNELNQENRKDGNDELILKRSDDFEMSNLGISLENKIKKKMLNVPEVPNSFKIKKSSGKGKENKKVKVKKKNSPLKALPCNDFPTTHKTDQSTNKDILKTEDNILNKRNGKMGSSSSVESISSDDDEEWNRRISTINYKIPTSGTYSFLASLSGNVY